MVGIDSDNVRETYTPYIKEQRKSVKRWLIIHREDIVLGTTAILLIKNHKLKKQNREIIKVVKEWKPVVEEARAIVQGANIFDHYFGPRH